VALSLHGHILAEQERYHSRGLVLKELFTTTHQPPAVAEWGYWAIS
jgi:hypothetical protein